MVDVVSSSILKTTHNHTIFLVTKLPIPGKSKTRLIPALVRYLFLLTNAETLFDFLVSLVIRVMLVQNVFLSA